MAAQVIRNGHNRADLSEFNLLKVLGEGGFGKVFVVSKVSGTDSDNLYAMKVQRKAALSINERRHMNLERDILVAIDHPFIAKLQYAFQTAGKLYLVLKFYRGGDLFTLLLKKIKLNENTTRFYLAELALALGYLHALGIIYRDLKPHNVLLDAMGHIVLTDFGLSEFLAEGALSYSFSGTVEYTAPEVVKRKGHSYAADWWSFGVFMFEMLTGMLPFEPTYEETVTTKILEAELELPTELSLQASSLLKALLQKDPKKRMGASPGGVEDLKHDEFFGSINFDDRLAKKIQPPFQPSLDGPDDEHFNSSITSQAPYNTTGISASASANEVFKGFSFVDPGLLKSETMEEKSEASLKPIKTPKRKFSDDCVPLETLETGNFPVCKQTRH